MAIFFTSDTHFGHRNIIKYCDRPFNNVWHMNHKLILNWNLMVSREDTVYHLGDFSFLPTRQTKEVIESLTGRITLIPGNHDIDLERRKLLGMEFFDDLGPAYSRSIEVVNPTPISLLDFLPGRNMPTSKLSIEVSHFPELIKGGHDLHLCGHIHTQWRSWERPDGTIIYNVGVDVWDYKPISLMDIFDDMKCPYFRKIGEWKDVYHG